VSRLRQLSGKDIPHQTSISVMLTHSSIVDVGNQTPLSAMGSTPAAIRLPRRCLSAQPSTTHRLLVLMMNYDCTGIPSMPGVAVAVTFSFSVHGLFFSLIP